MADKNDICEKQKQYKWGSKVIDRLSLDMRSEFPQSEGFSRTNLYDIKRWFAFYSSQIEFVHQAGGQLQKVDNANTPIPEILNGSNLPQLVEDFVCQVGGLLKKA